MTRSMLKMQDIAEINDLINGGWCLVGPTYPLTSGWYLQEGKPGGGGRTKRIHAAVAQKVASRMNKVSPYRLEYVGFKR